MTDKKNPENSAFGGGIPHMKDAAILMGWIAILVLIAGLIWFFTQPMRTRALMNAVNRVLEQSDDSRRLGEPVTPGSLKPGVLGMGSWYNLEELTEENFYNGSKVFIFTLIVDGTFFPCAAVLNSEGIVEEFIPLNSYGKKIMQRISPGILRIYTRRLQGFDS